MKLVWEKIKVCIEYVAGVGVEVALGDEFAIKYRVEDGFEKVGVILCDGNVDVLKITNLQLEKVVQALKIYKKILKNFYQVIARLLLTLLKLNKLI